MKHHNRQKSEQICKIHQVITKQPPGQIQSVATASVATLCLPHTTPSIHKHKYFLDFRFSGKHFLGFYLYSYLFNKYSNHGRVDIRIVEVYSYSNTKYALFCARLFLLNVLCVKSMLWMHGLVIPSFSFYKVFQCMNMPLFIHFTFHSFELILL